MGGGILQLVAYGAQDLYITGSPQVTFFRLVYRRHTNFAQETIEQTFQGNADFGKKVTCLLSRNGDLIHRIWLMCKLPDITVEVPTAGGTNEFRWLNWLGHLLIQTVELEIGGQRIDKHYGEFMHVYAELSMKAGHQVGYANMVGNVPKLTALTKVTDTDEAVTINGTTLYVPLQFFFCRNPGLCLPLVALQYHEIKINFEFRPFDELVHYNSVNGNWRPHGPNGGTPSMQSCSLLVDYIFLDADERRRFAQSGHELLITQIQYTGAESTSQINNKFKLTFNHPTKELIWFGTQDRHEKKHDEDGPTTGRQWFNFTTKTDETYLTGVPSDPLGGGMGYAASINPIIADNTPGYSMDDAGTWTSKTRDLLKFDEGENLTEYAKLQLNGHDRFSEREGRWFNLCVPYACHENIPSTGVNVYSFALRPDEHQPSGSINFSRIDNASLHIKLREDAVKVNNEIQSCKIKIFAVSYNILRVLSGMGGLAYAN